MALGGARSHRVLKLEVAGNDEPSKALRQVARRFSEDLPQLSIHLTWLLGEEAEKRTAFFEALGEALAESGQAEAGLEPASPLRRTLQPGLRPRRVLPGLGSPRPDPGLRPPSTACSNHLGPGRAC